MIVYLEIWARKERVNNVLNMHCEHTVNMFYSRSPPKNGQIS